MKFLCVPCDTPMTLAETTPPDRGSVSLRYGCPACGYEFAMMTNPFETQLVASLGVKVGPREAGQAAGETPGGACPFGEMVRDADGGATSAGPATNGAGTAGQGGNVTWTADALERLGSIPSFVRPMARSGIEKFARERGHDRIDGSVLDEAREFFGM